MLQTVDDWIKRIGSLVALISVIVSAFIGQGSPIAAYVFLAIAFVLALWTWWRVVLPMPPDHKFLQLILKGLVLVLIIAAALGLGYGIWWGWQGQFGVILLSVLLGVIVTIGLGVWWTRLRLSSISGYETLKVVVKAAILLFILAAAFGLGFWLWQVPGQSEQPHFDITALRTLRSDRNIYEVTDSLITNKDNLDEYGIGITFTLQIVPQYGGNRRFGQVVAIISGEGGSVEKVVWPNFSSNSDAQSIDLSFAELLRVSDLKQNSDPPQNSFQSDALSFQQATVTITIAQASNKTSPWANQDILIRNSPWELRSDLVWRHAGYELDTYVKNLGGTGNFTVRYRLVRLDQEIGMDSHPINSGTTSIGSWNEPKKPIPLKNGEIFTDTVSVYDKKLPPGRYLLELYPVKQQNYVQFQGTNSWDNVNAMDCPWCFSGAPGPMRYQRWNFLITESEFPLDKTVQAELDRLIDEQGINLGFPLGLAEEVTSATGTEGLRQVFRDGEIYLYEDHVYALYGPILDRYKELGDVQDKNLGFPISPIKSVTSSSGTEGMVMEFEGPGSGQPPTTIYASAKGVGVIKTWIGMIYLENGGYSGWLGFPLADEQYYTNSTSQMFEYGYIVYQHPDVKGEPDWGRAPVAYPYLASRGTLVDVDAQQIWQYSGVKIKPGDRVTIVQTGGAWSIVDGKSVDANGAADEVLQESFTLPSIHPGVLIGRIGESNAPMFPVGRWSTFIAQTEGSLYLAMNDNEYNDNSGFITVQVMVEEAGLYSSKNIEN